MILDERKESVIRDEGYTVGVTSFSRTGPESVSGSYSDSPFVQTVP